jgi:hypothetical protein
MIKNQTFTMDENEFSEKLAQAVELGIERYELKHSQQKIYTINEVSKKLKKSHKTVSRMVANGFLTATADNRITRTELDRYLMAQ